MCARCGTPTEGPVGKCAQCIGLRGFARARSLVVYAEPARSLTLALKRRGGRDLARAMSGLMSRVAARADLRGDTVCFVPGGRRARRQGFDQAELLAHGVGRAMGLPVRRHLFRTREGPRQADVSMIDRRSNVRGRFAARPTRGAVLLVDDVYTTGTTAEACSLALLESGAESVDVITWARTVRRR
jgi:ComF family protein